MKQPVVVMPHSSGERLCKPLTAPSGQELHARGRRLRGGKTPPLRGDDALQRERCRRDVVLFFFSFIVSRSKKSQGRGGYYWVFGWAGLGGMGGGVGWVLTSQPETAVREKERE